MESLDSSIMELQYKTTLTVEVPSSPKKINDSYFQTIQISSPKLTETTIQDIIPMFSSTILDNMMENPPPAFETTDSIPREKWINPNPEPEEEVVTEAAPPTKTSAPIIIEPALTIPQPLSSKAKDPTSSSLVFGAVVVGVIALASAIIAKRFM